MFKISKEFKLILVISLISIMFSFIINGKIDVETYVTTGSVFMGSLYGAALIIIYNMDNEYISTFYRYLTVGFSGSALLTISFVMLFKKGFADSQTLGMLSKMFVITSFYQPSSLIFAFKNQHKNINYKRLIAANLLLVFASLFLCYRIDLSFLNHLYQQEGRDIGLALLVLAYVYAGILTNNKKYNYNIEHKIKVIINCFVVSRIFMISIILSRLPMIFPIGVVVYYSLILLGDYFMVKILVAKIIWQPERILYQELINKSDSLKNTVDELTKAKKDIEDIAERSLKLINNMPVGILLLTDAKISFVNDELNNMFNITDKNVLIGKSLMDLLDTSNRGIDEQSLLKQCSRSDAKYDFLYNNVKLTCSLHIVQAGTIGEDSYIAIVENLSEKIHIQKLHDQMEKHKKQEVVKDDFLANLSHEFKTPINVIYSAIQMEDLSKRTGNVSAITKYNDIIKKNCYRLIKLINNFIDTTRIQQGTIKTNFKPLNIVSLVEDTTMSVISYAENRGLTITFDTDEEEVFVNADSLLIERVVLNLISNAIKYNRDNGHIDVVVKSTENEAAVFVKDTGVGISAEHQCRMFNRYERLDKKLAREKEGSGLGLNIVKEIIDLHKGRIDVSSKEGVGTSISFVLPITKGEFNCYDDIDANSCEINSKLKYTADVEMSDIMQ